MSVTIGLNYIYTTCSGQYGNSQYFREMARRRGDSSSSDSSTDSSPAGSRRSRGDESSPSPRDREAMETIQGDHLEDFYASKARIDSKPTTLELQESSIGFYFGTLLRDGEMSKEGREKLRYKYYLKPAVFGKLQAPQLDDTKLSALAQKENRDSNESRLASIHGR